MMSRQFKLIPAAVSAAVLLASCTHPVPAEPSAEPTYTAEASSYEEGTQENTDSGTAENETVSESDSDQNFNRFNAQLTKSGNTVYFFNSLMGSNHYMRFADLTSGVSGPLCGKPECVHQGGDCNSFLSDTMSLMLSRYEGKLYWVTNNVKDRTYILMRMDGNGENHETVRTLGKSGEGSTVPTGNPYFQIHRGTACAAGYNSEVTDGKYLMWYLGKVYDLSGDGEVTLVDRKTLNAAGILMQCYGPYVYFIYKECPYERDSDLPMEERAKIDVNIEIIRYNVETKETETLRDAPAPMAGMGGFIVTESGLYFQCIMTDGTNRVVYWEEEDDEFRECFAQEQPAYASLSVRGLVEIAQDEEGTEETVTLYGWDGEKILQNRYEWEALKDVRSMYYCGVDEENIYCEYMVRTGDKEELAVTAFPLDGSDMKLLWRGE